MTPIGGGLGESTIISSEFKKTTTTTGTETLLNKLKDLLNRKYMAMHVR